MDESSEKGERGATEAHMEKVAAMTVKELKKTIVGAGLSHADCLEKQELRARALVALSQTTQAAGTGGAAADGAAAGCPAGDDGGKDRAGRGSGFDSSGGGGGSGGSGGSDGSGGSVGPVCAHCLKKPRGKVELSRCSRCRVTACKFNQPDCLSSATTRSLTRQPPAPKVLW